MNSPAILWMYWTDTLNKHSQCGPVCTPGKLDWHRLVKVAAHGLETWLRNQNVCQNRGFWKGSLTSLNSPSFWMNTLNFLQLLSPHHGCFQISISSTDFLNLFLNTRMFTLSITITTLAYYLKATELHCISIGRHNMRAQPNALANLPRSSCFGGPSEISAVWLWSGYFALPDCCLQSTCSQGDKCSWFNVDVYAFQGM